MAHRQDRGTSAQKQFATCLAGNGDKFSVSESVMVLLSEPAQQSSLGCRTGSSRVLGVPGFLGGLSSVLSKGSSGVLGVQGLPHSPAQPHCKSHRLQLPWPAAKNETDAGLEGAKSLCGSREAGLSLG